ncbi:Aste57867_12456 [Aphanomyces stellatus]|uniref:Aste57867_12456 protein n=1 Tax=Aphanomyces stellatus TaxID=120398 RepID=A0A485KVN9_9STRA|nr:hypothetical protein As57867_012410 [Aphanomyces stellatus]VFT89307.1 Aste57867_12456 [Aphanomyces stellatus]
MLVFLAIAFTASAISSSCWPTSVHPLPSDAMIVLTVQADGIFDGHRHIRVPEGISLHDLARALQEQLTLDTVKLCMDSLDAFVLDITTDSIVPLEDADQLQTHTRLFLRTLPSSSPRNSSCLPR